MLPYPGRSPAGPSTQIGCATQSKSQPTYTLVQGSCQPGWCCMPLTVESLRQENCRELQASLNIQVHSVHWAARTAQQGHISKQSNRDRSTLGFHPPLLNHTLDVLLPFSGFHLENIVLLGRTPGHSSSNSSWIFLGTPFLRSLG